MTTYIRGTTATFSHYWLDDDNNPLVPLDTTYPTIQVEDPDGSIVASGVAMATANPGEYSWNWAINANATLGSGWSIRQNLTDVNYDTHSYVETFAVADQVETPTSLDRFQGYLTLKGQDERLVWQGAVDPTDIQVTLKDQNGDDVWTKVKVDLTAVTEDGYYTYYYDTTAADDHATEGQYLAVWRSRNSVGSPWQNQVQWLVVPYDVFWYVQPSLKMLVDKLNKVTTTPLSYVDLEYWQAYTQGIDLCNSIHPFTSFTWANFPTAFYVYWVYAASLYLLQARQLLEIEVSHQQVGQTVTLDYNHADPLSEVIGRFENYLYERMVPAKTAAFRQSSNVAVCGVRPYRLTSRNRVYRAGSSNSMLGELPGLLDNLGIWV